MSDTDIKNMEAYLQRLIALWEEHGNDEEELLLEELELDVKIETTEHMLKMAGIDIEHLI